MSNLVDAAEGRNEAQGQPSHGIVVTEVLSVRRYKRGYEVRREFWDAGLGEPTEMLAAYTPRGDYIGNPKTARRLVADRGIQPEKRTADSCVCSIGYSVKDGKWYGWSHRAIFGFKVGSTCRKGNCHYLPANKQDFAEESAQWHGGKVVEETKFGVTVEKPNGIQVAEDYPSEFGRGEWTAKTTADARQMAIDFASSVS